MFGVADNLLHLSAYSPTWQSLIHRQWRGCQADQSPLCNCMDGPLISRAAIHQNCESETLDISEPRSGLGSSRIRITLTYIGFMPRGILSTNRRSRTESEIRREYIMSKSILRFVLDEAGNIIDTVGNFPPLTFCQRDCCKTRDEGELNNANLFAAVCSASRTIGAQSENGVALRSRSSLFSASHLWRHFCLETGFYNWTGSDRKAVCRAT